MEFNKFIQELIGRYSKHGVSEIAISVMGGICVISLVGKNEIRKDTMYVGIERPEDLENIPLIYAETRLYLPIDEEKVLKDFDESFELASKAPPVVVEGVSHSEFMSALRVTSTTKCRECPAILEEDNIYGLCAYCYERSIN